MKRKLPQWLLDATNNNDKSTKPNQTESIRTISNHSHINSSHDIENQSEQHSTATNAPSEHQPNNGSINIVPLANLLSPSRGGAPVNEPHKNLSNETELATIETISVEATMGVLMAVVIKTETPDPNEETASDATNEQQVAVKTEIKDEPMDTASSNGTKPAPSSLVPKIEDVKPGRRSCNYGIKCFRRNPDHRAELAHPGDVDYRRPSLPNAPAGTPACPWGAACYRRNPQHFMQLSHPPATNSTTTTVYTGPQSNPPQRRNRNRMVVDNADSDAEDDYDLEDPFIDDGSSDEYVPDGDGDDDDDDPEDSQVTDS